jgi:LCP family protein required for cell wall assembly
MKCNNFDDIVLYIDGALSDEASKAIEDHIKDCEDCRKMVETLISTRSFLKEESIPDKSIDAKVLNTIDKNRYIDQKNKFILFQGLMVFKSMLKPAAAIIFICAALLWLGYGRYFKDSQNPILSHPSKDASQPVNILVLGNDSYKNTDAIALINYDPISTQLNILSIPRDTSVTLNDSQTKLSLVYREGASDATSKAVSDLLKVGIKYYVCIDTITAQKSIDLLDGVDFNSPVNLDYEDPMQDLRIHIKKGQNHLTGKQAVEFMMFRIPSRRTPSLLKHYDGSDIKRIEAQQNMIRALIEQKLNIRYLSKINEFVKTALSGTETNFFLGDALNLLKNISKLNPNDVNMFTLPGQWDSSHNYTIDNEASQNIVKNYFQSNVR